MLLPELLRDPSDERPIRVLSRYYTVGDFAQAEPYTGARFDTWDSTGTRHQDLDRFTADDLVAVSFLSVEVSAQAAIRLLDTRRDEFSDLLAAVGEDRDLADEREAWPSGWAGDRLWDALRSLPGIGPTTASKLFARKRPRLRPIYDTVIAGVIGSTILWEPLRATLVASDSLNERLLSLRQQAGLPDEVSAIRVFDVLTWMEGKGHANP